MCLFGTKRLQNQAGQKSLSTETPGNSSLNVIGPYNLIGSGTIRRCMLGGVGMDLLEELCYCGYRL